MSEDEIKVLPDYRPYGVEMIFEAMLLFIIAVIMGVILATLLIK